MSSSICNLFFLSLLVCFSQGSKILIVSPLPAYSHFQLSFRIAKELADRNHEVTMISSFPQKTPIKNLRDVSVAEMASKIEDIKNNILEFDTYGFIETLNTVHGAGILFTELTLTHKNVQDLLNSGDSFDVVILQHFFNDALMGVAYKFNAPLILLSPGPSSIFSNHLFANPEPSSYVPNLLSNVGDLKSFCERLKNFFCNIASSLVKELYYIPTQRRLFKKYITTDIELDSIMYNASLMLTNSHYSTHPAIPLLPNIIEIGGITIYPLKPLPDDVKQFLDDAKDGAVLFSLGSNIRSKDLKPEIRKALLQSFSKIKQKVLWKFEADLPDKPPNVKIMPWVPQQDALAHPNVRAFISHGGLLSTIEAVYHGVPILGIPVIAEQKQNIATASRKGYAISIRLSDITEETFSSALHEILNNPKYRHTIRESSSLLRDRPLSPVETAVYWVEHVIRNRGAPHLKSAGRDLTWYQLYMIDIIISLTAFVTAVTVIFFIGLKKLLQLVLNILFSSKISKQIVTKTKKNK